MKAAITDGAGKVWIEDLPVPEPNEYQCLCKNLVCATCTGTDRKHIHNKLPWKQKYPGILGHESIGVVVETGKKVRNFHIGDRVIRPTAVYQGECYHGYTSLWGGYAEYGLVTDGAAMLADNPAAVLNHYVQFQLKIPDDLTIDPADAAQLITLKEVTGFAQSVGVTLNTPVLLLGIGSVGLAFCCGIRLLGAYPLMVAVRRNDQRDMALDMGADFVINTSEQNLVEAVAEITRGAGAARIIDATGSVNYIEECSAAAAPDGKICPYATYPADDPAEKHIPAGRLLRGATGEVRTHDALCSAARHGLLRLNRLYSHRLPLRMIAEGFEMLEHREAVKIVFDMP